MNRFENAYVGVKRLRAAVILKLISSILSVVSAILVGIVLGASAIAAVSDTSSSALVAVGISGILGLLLPVVGVILGIIAFILTLMGLSRAGQDNPQFKSALLWVFINIVLIIVAAIFSKYLPPALIGGINALANIMDLIIIIFVTRGCAELLPELAPRAKTIQTLVCIPVIITAISNVITSATSTINPIVSVIFSIIIIVASLAYFFMYLGFLGRAKKLLSGV